MGLNISYLINKLLGVQIKGTDVTLPAQIKGSDVNLPVQLTGSNVAEQKTQADAVTGTVTFSQSIQHLEIYNVDATNQGVFNVNGINTTVPAGKPFKASFGGTPRATVTITGSTSYILTRYE